MGSGASTRGASRNGAPSVDAGTQPIASALSDLELYRRMLRIRRVEERLLALHADGVLSGTTHTGIGQEAVAVGVLAHLAGDDAVFSTHRCHGHFLAAGGDMGALLAELMGRAGGVSGGRGGSQHLSTPRFVSSGVQGQLLPVALGAALVAQLRNRGSITVAFVGDGTLGQGVLYETLNLAALWQVPLLVVLEDNGIAQTTPAHAAVSGDVVARAGAFGIDARALDADHVRDVLDDLAPTFAAMRVQPHPVFRVLRTVRLGPHSKGDDDRPDSLLRELRARDPVVLLAERLPAEARADIDEQVARELDEAVAFASASPAPDAAGADASAALPPARAIAEALPEEEIPPRVVESLNGALHRLLADDPDVHVFGQDLLDPYGGAFKVTRGLSSAFPLRVHSTPISEAATLGAATGFALAGGKAIVEIMFGDFVTLAVDQIVNSAAQHWYLSHGRAAANVVVRVPMGGGRGYGPTHSQSLERLFFGIPGLRVVAVSSFVDPGTLLATAVAGDPAPVVFVENKLVYTERIRRATGGYVDHFSARTTDGPYPNVRLSPAAFAAPDAVVIAYGRAASIAWDAVRSLFLDHELVVDLCVISQLAPLDLDGVLDAALAARCVVTVEEGPVESGFGAEVAARLAEAGFRGDVARVGARPVPIPASRALEDLVLPSTADVRAALERRLLRGGSCR